MVGEAFVDDIAVRNSDIELSDVIDLGATAVIIVLTAFIAGLDFVFGEFILRLFQR